MAFKCIEGCSECCTIIPLHEDFWNQMMQYSERVISVQEVMDMPENQKYTPGNYIVPITSDMKCCFLDAAQKCKIYKKRPIICKEYGIRRSLQCNYVKPNGWRRTPQEENLMKTISLNLNEARQYHIMKDKK